MIWKNLRKWRDKGMAGNKKTASEVDELRRMQDNVLRKLREMDAKALDADVAAASRMISPAAAQQASTFASKYEALYNPAVAPPPSIFVNTPARDQAVVIHSMCVTRIENGLIMDIDCGDGYRKVFVESVDKLGEAVVTAIVTARVTK